MILEIGSSRFEVNNIYFISPMGDDTNPGTEDKPFKSFKNTVKNKLLAGDSLCFLPGDYLLDDKECEVYNDWTFAGFSDYGKRIIFFTRYPEDVKITINYTAANYERNHYLSLFANNSRAINLNFIIKSSSTKQSYANAIFTGAGGTGSNYVTYENCNIYAESKGNISIMYYCSIIMNNCNLVIKDILSTNYSGGVKMVNCFYNNIGGNGITTSFCMKLENLGSLSLTQLAGLNYKGDPTILNTNGTPSIIGLAGGPSSLWSFIKVLIKSGDIYYCINNQGLEIVNTIEEAVNNKKINGIRELSEYNPFKLLDTLKIIKI